MSTFTVNGEKKTANATTLEQLLDELEYLDSTVATAVNGEFVAKHARKDFKLADGDSVEVLAPMQGG